MNRYERVLEAVSKERRIAFVPFTVLGFPDVNRCEENLETMISAGADCLELGIPFSDPLADGPTIQKAMCNALRAGVTPDDCLKIVNSVRGRHPDLPIGLLVYANLVYSRGSNEFFRACNTAGVDSVLIADVPIDEAATFASAASQAGVGLVHLCPPNVDQPRLERIAKSGFGYTYLLSRAGVTGSGVAAGRPVKEILDSLRASHAPPPFLGFGISRPEHVHAAAESGAAGVICGSAIIEILLDDSQGSENVNSNLRRFVREMRAATAV